MIKNPTTLINDFQHAMVAAAIGRTRSTVEHEAQAAPHRPHSLPKGKCAVYVFSLSQVWGSSCPAGPDRVLKVGKAGLMSNARFLSQHYNPISAGSTLAGSLIRCRVLWPYLGISNLELDRARNWIREHLDRDNFYLDVADEHLLGQLETFVRGTLGSVFEGTEARKNSVSESGVVCANLRGRRGEVTIGHPSGS